MLKISGTGIRLTRGDSTRFTIRLTGQEVPDGTKTVFTVKKRAWRHGDAVIELEVPVVSNAVHVLLTPDDTNVDAGDYVWDLRVFVDNEDGTEDVLTPMDYALFCVTEAIGNE